MLKDIIYKNKKLKYKIDEYGNIYSYFFKSPKLLKPDIDKDGYFKVTLAIRKNKYKHFFVHRLVAMMFVSGYSENLVVNHIDGNKQNTYYKNLEWVTLNENEKHASINYLKANGERNSHCVYPDKKIHEICDLLEDGLSVSKISSITKIPKYYIYFIKNRSIRKEISDYYDINHQRSTTREIKDRMCLVRTRLFN